MSHTSSNLGGTTVSSFIIGEGGDGRTLFVGTGDPNTTGPPSPVQGDLFISDGTFWQFDGASWTQFGAGGGGAAATLTKSITIKAPTECEDVTMFFTPVAITVVSVQAVVIGTTPSVTIDPKHSTDRSAVGNDILSVPVAITNTTTGQTLTTFDDDTIPANSWVWLETTAKTGTVDELAITIKYTED